MLNPSVYALSKWVHVYEKDDSIALYHALTIDLVFIKPHARPLMALLKYGTTIDHANKLDKENTRRFGSLIMELLDRGFVASLDSDEDELFRQKKNKYCQPPGLETLYLLLTDTCNLQCSYCFILNGMPQKYKHGSMSLETAKKAVDIFFKNIKKNPHFYDTSRKAIQFYGGEPLINFGVLKETIDYVERAYNNELSELGERFIFSVVTNGTLINDDIAKYISSNPRVSITVSLDGDAWQNDKKRIYRDGSGSYSDAINGVRILKENGCNNISLSCTIDDHNIDGLEELLKLNEQYQFLSINMNPMLDTETDRVSQEYTSKVNERLIAYFEKARSAGIYEDRVIRKIRPFITHKIHTHDCQATGHQIVCSPDGRLGLCHEGVGMKNYFFSDISSKFDFHSDPVVSEWNRRTPLNMPQCKDCPAIGICGGGCAYGAELRNGSIWSVDDRFCNHSLSMLEWVIWDIHKQGS